MTTAAFLEVAVYFGLLTALAVPLGAFTARVLTVTPGTGLVARVERGLWRVAGVDPAEQMGWRRYATAVLLFNAAGLLLVYLLQRLQAVLPGNPAGLAAVDPWVAWNAAVSFATNTNWQAYAGESTMSHLVQMAALTVQNFLSAATGIAVLAALVRGLVARSACGLGSFWADLTRITLRLLLPLSAVLALALVWQGVPQTFSAEARWPVLSPSTTAAGDHVTEQVVALPACAASGSASPSPGPSRRLTAGGSPPRAGPAAARCSG